MKVLSGNVWCEELGNEYQLLKERLHALPGLRHAPKSARVEGSIDAVAAACARLDRPLPRLPEPAEHAGSHLFPYQRRGIGWLIAQMRQHGGALLADDMGLGKTLQSIEASKVLLGDTGRALVVCPAFLRANWVAELERWGETSVVSLGPKTNKRTKTAWDAAGLAKWVVVSYDLAHKALPTAFPRNSPRVLILDEAQMLKGRDNKRAKILQDVAAMSTYRLAITGTPMWSRPRDLYQLLKLLFGMRFGNSFEFDVAYAGGTINIYGGLDNKGATNAEELKLRVGYYMLRRLKEEVLEDLPALMRNVVWVEPEQVATAAFHTAISAQHMGATHRALEATLKAKMEPALMLASQAKKFLLFTWLKEHAAEMHRLLNEDFDTPCELVTGDMPADKRVGAVNRAAARGCGVVATIDSMGAGINAQSIGNVGIFHAIDYVPAKMAQAEARLHRIGQTRGVTWTYIAMKESMDELVVRTVIDKLDQQHAVLGGTMDMRNAFDDSNAADADADLRALYESL